MIRGRIAINDAQTGDRTWLDHLADQFGRAWKRGGERPRIEDFLADAAEPRRALLVQELIRVERELRKQAGEAPTPVEYNERFPNNCTAVGVAFGAEDAVDSPAPPEPITAARSLLFGLLALQNGFVDRDTLLAAFNAWVLDKSRSLGQILVDRGALMPAGHDMLADLVAEHLRQYGQDPERSLAVLTVVPDVRDGLAGLADLDLQTSIL